MFDRANRRKRRAVLTRRVPVPLLALSAFTALGVLGGYAAASNSAPRMGNELQRYFETYLALGTRSSFGAETLLGTIVCYFRAPFFAFLLGFASVGVLLIPLVCAFQGFLISYSLFCFAFSLGRVSFPLLLALFGIRLLTVLPCMLLLGTAALDKSRSLLLLSCAGPRAGPVAYGSAYWYRFGVGCVCLFLGSMLELWLVPQFLLLAAS